MTKCAEPKIRTVAKLAPDQFFTDEINLLDAHFRQTLRLLSTLTDLIYPQSEQGRGINGWWAPGYTERLKVNYCYPDTAIEDVMVALGQNVAEEHKKRQRVIDDIRAYFNVAQNVVVNNGNGSNTDPHENGIALLNDQLEPLGGITMLIGNPIGNPLNVLIGAYIGSCIDSAEYRSKCEEKFGINMHKGICAPVNREKMNYYGLTLQGLARMEAKGMNLDELIKKGVVSNSTSELYSDGYVSGYIELHKGYGISDDAAFLAVALLFGLDAAWGFLLMDAIDTWDKSAPKIYYGGQDEMSGRSIRKTYEANHGPGSFPVSENDVLNVIYLAAIDERSKNDFPSCSQRRFVEINPNTGICPLQSHMEYFKKITEGGYMPPPMKIAFQQVSTDRFYGTFKKRYDEFVSKGEVAKAYNLPLNGK